MLTCDDASKKCQVLFKNLSAFLKAFSLRSMCAKFLVNL